MWDVPDEPRVHLSHDIPCPRCHHDLHTFLACGDECACPPCIIPGSAA